MQEITTGIEHTALPAQDIADICALLSRKRLTLMVKRFYDIIFSTLGLIVLLPFFAIIALLIKLDSPGPVFYHQVRIGKNGVPFRILKFRKMHDNIGEGGSNLTLANDRRMTRIGYFLRKTKIDELPQAVNVLLGDMAVVGPRPETPNYVCLYSPEQREVLKIKPGITDYASIYFINEGDLLEKAKDPETYYIKSIMPQKIRLNLKYIEDMSFLTDMKIIYLTFRNIIKSL